MKIEEIKPYPRNARHNERAIPKVAESIREFGLRGTIGLESKENPVRVSEPNKYGRIYYQVNMEIGISKKSKVATFWAKGKHDKAPKFVTLRPYKPKKDDF